MKTVIAVNASPRAKWNTAQAVREAAAGAQDAGAHIEVFDLYKLEPFMGCRSCFACMTEKSWDRCAIKDGLSEVLDKISQADGLILGSPNYFGRPTAGFRALFERLCFQHLTYQAEQFCSNERRIPVLFIMTSNAPIESYEVTNYDEMLAEYEQTLGNFVGPTKSFVCGNTLQTDRYDMFKWNVFDVAAKQQRHEEVFPSELAEVRKLASELFA